MKTLFSRRDFFTTKGDALYTYILAPQPATQDVTKSPATNSPHTGGQKVNTRETK